MTIARNLLAVLLAAIGLAIAEGAVENARDLVSIYMCAELVVILLTMALLASSIGVLRRLSNRVFAVAAGGFVPGLGVCVALTWSVSAGLIYVALGMIPFVLYLWMHLVGIRAARRLRRP